jgi:rhodanese-related sulfurtransferase
MPSTKPTARTRAHTITVDELHERLAHGEVRILDVRTAAEYGTAHIPGSSNVPLATLAEHRAELARHLSTDDTTDALHGATANQDVGVVLVCRSGARATQAEQALAAAGRTDLRILDGGMVAWEQAGAPVNRGRQTWDIERQVRFVAGSVVAGSVLGSQISPRLKWVAAALGTGLVTAALTNSCAMGAALSRMPWNRGTTDPDIRTILADLGTSTA